MSAIPSNGAERAARAEVAAECGYLASSVASRSTAVLKHFDGGWKLRVAAPWSWR